MLPMWRFRPRGWDEMSWYKLATYDTALPRTQVMEIKRNFCRLSSCSQEDRLWTRDSRTAFSHPCKTVTVFISRKSYLLSNLDFHTRMMNQINTRPDHTGCHLPQQDHVLCLFVFRNYFFKKKKNLLNWTEHNIWRTQIRVLYNVPRHLYQKFFSIHKIESSIQSWCLVLNIIPLSLCKHWIFICSSFSTCLFTHSIFLFSSKAWRLLLKYTLLSCIYSLIRQTYMEPLLCA